MTRVSTTARSEREVTSRWEGLGDVTVSANVPLANSLDGLLVGALPAAMRLGGEISVDGEVDAVLVENAGKAGALLHRWYPDLSQPTITADAVTGGQAAAGVGCFFSGGVDSFYSALRNRDRLTHLIFVQGFDVDMDNTELGEAAVTGAREAAEALGLPLIEARTDIRRVTDEHAEWGTQQHGAALAMVGHLLGTTLGHVIIPASYHVSDLFPWGSHPDLDPLWSSSTVTFEHHGHDATRPQKVASIADDAAAMKHLRVCWENPGNAYNCGRCEKCIRTMINLRVVGAGDRCATLPHEIPDGALRSLRLSHGGQIFARENLEAMRAADVHDEQLERALRRAIRSNRLRDVARAVKVRFSSR